VAVHVRRGRAGRGGEDLRCYSLQESPFLNQVYIFDSLNPRDVRVVDVSGFRPDEGIAKVDFRPATGRLYAVTFLNIPGGNVGSNVYVIDTDTLVATKVAALDAETYLLGADFDPVTDRLVVTNERDYEKRVVNVDTGEVTVEAPLRFADYDVGRMFPPLPTGVAYSNNSAVAASTTMFLIDMNSPGSLVKEEPYRSGVMHSVGPLGFQIYRGCTTCAGFDISGMTGLAYAALMPDVPGGVGPIEHLYLIDLSTGKAEDLGEIGGPHITFNELLAPVPSPHESIDDSRVFVRRHYYDFLSRDPDDAGLAFWTGEIEGCGADARCREVKRVNVSAAFFLSIEFQETGYLAYRALKAAYGDPPGAPVPLTLFEFLPAKERLGRGVVVGRAGGEARLEENKAAFFDSFALSPRFGVMLRLTAEVFVDALDFNAGGVLSASERAALVNSLRARDDAAGRVRVLRAVAENAEFKRRERNRAFVLMEYFGYLRRNPSDAPEPTLGYDGYNFWLGKLEQFGGDFVRAEMVRAFISSDEYRKRFGR
jgi:hypothetical protein